MLATALTLWFTGEKNRWKLTLRIPNVCGNTPMSNGYAMKRMLLVLFFSSLLLNTFLTRLRMRSCKYKFILAGWSRFNLVKMLSGTCLWYRNVKRITVEGKLVLWSCSNGTFGRAEVTSWQSIYKKNSTIRKRCHDNVFFCFAWYTNLICIELF